MRARPRGTSKALPATFVCRMASGCSCSPQPAFAEAEETDQRVEMAAVGGRFDEIDVRGAGELAQLLAATAGCRRVSPAHLCTTRVEQEPMACLGILQLDETDRGEVLLARIGNADSHQVMAPAGVFQGALE